MKKENLKTGNKVILEDGQELLVLLNADLYGFSDTNLLVSLKESPDYFRVVSLDNWDDNLQFIQDENNYIDKLDIVQCYKTDDIINDSSIDMLYDIKNIYFSKTDIKILDIVDTNIVNFIAKKGHTLKLYDIDRGYIGMFPIADGCFSDLPQNYLYDLNKMKGTKNVY